MPFGASPSDWDHLDLVLGLREHLLPVVSKPDAVISPHSMLKRLGQIPSLYNFEGKAAGFTKWTEHHSTPEDLVRWKSQPDYGICIQTRALRAFDCDITNEVLAEKVFRFFNSLACPLPTRGRANASKFLKPFRLSGPYAKRILKLKDGNEGDKIEFLADGQQFIAIGTHPSGARYQWVGGLPHDIPELTPDQFETFWTLLQKEFGLEPAIIEQNNIRNAPGGAINDGKLSFLEQAGVVLGWSQEGSAYVSCPFKAGHSKEGDKTETIYFPAGLRGYESGHFNCLHASCSGRSDDDFLNALGYTASLFDTLPVEEIDASPAKTSLFTFVDVDEFSIRAPQEYLIKDIMPRADLIVLFGESGSGKSFIALDAAFSIARGVDWNGKKVKQGRVAYVVAEGAGGFRKRTLAYAQHYGVNLASIPISVLADQPNLLDTKNATALGEAIKELGPVSAVFIDTFAQTTPGANENSAEDIGKALAHCRSISKMTGATIVLIHHAGKDLTKGARGWSGLRAAADAEIEVSRSDCTRNIKISKQKDGEDGAEWGVIFNEINIGIDEDDQIITSCVVEYTQKQRPKAKEKKRGALQQLILGALDAAGEQYIATNIISDTVKAMLPPMEGRDTRGQRVRRAIEEMVLQGDLSLRDGAVGLPLSEY